MDGRKCVNLYVYFTAVGLINIPDEKESLEMMEEIRRTAQDLKKQEYGIPLARYTVFLQNRPSERRASAMDFLYLLFIKSRVFCKSPARHARPARSFCTNQRIL